MGERAEVFPLFEASVEQNHHKNRKDKTRFYEKLLKSLNKTFAKLF